MAERVTVWLLQAETGVLALIILFAAITHFRDELIRWGWLPGNSWLARVAKGAERARIWRVLREVGFGEDHFHAIARTFDVEQAKKRNQSSLPLSYRLLAELKPWTMRL